MESGRVIFALPFFEPGNILTFVDRDGTMHPNGRKSTEWNDLIHTGPLPVFFVIILFCYFPFI